MICESYNQAIRNAQDGISLVQTAEGALNEVHAILQRMRELSVSANNSATNDGVAEQAEVDELLAELDAIGTRTSFSGQQVFDGVAREFQVGAAAADTLSVALGTLASDDVGGIDLSAIDVTTDQALTDLDSAIAGVSAQRSTLGASQNRLEHTIANLSVASENLAASESRIRDTDMAQEMMSFTRAQILQQAGTAMLAQANQVPQTVLSLLR